MVAELLKGKVPSKEVLRRNASLHAFAEGLCLATASLDRMGGTTYGCLQRGLAAEALVGRNGTRSTYLVHVVDIMQVGLRPPSKRASE